MSANIHVTIPHRATTYKENSFAVFPNSAITKTYKLPHDESFATLKHQYVYI